MVHYHFQMEQRSISTIIKDMLCVPLYKLPNSFITISNAVANDLKKKTSANVLVVENFIDKKNYQKIDNPPPSFNEKNVIKIVLPGRLLNKQKGQLDFVEAINYLKMRIAKISFVILLVKVRTRRLLMNTLNDINLVKQFTY